MLHPLLSSPIFGEFFCEIKKINNKDNKKIKNFYPLIHYHDHIELHLEFQDFRRWLATSYDSFDCSGFKNIHRENTPITFKIQIYVLLLCPFDGRFSMITKSVWHTSMVLFAIIGGSGSLFSKTWGLSQYFHLESIHSCITCLLTPAKLSRVRECKFNNFHLCISRSSIE